MRAVGVMWNLTTLSTIVPYKNLDPNKFEILALNFTATLSVILLTFLAYNFSKVWFSLYIYRQIFILAVPKMFLSGQWLVSILINSVWL